MKLRRAGFFTIAALLALILYASVSLAGLRTKIADASATEAQLREEVTEAEERNAELQYAIDHAGDPDMMEDIARQKLGLVMPDEKLFVDTGS